MYQLDLLRVEADSDYRNEARHRCITDHFFLADVLGKGFNGFIPRIHNPVRDLYFPKNPNLPIDQQHAIKNRMHLDPRTTGKTTFGRVDQIQWILAFPEEITILTETATRPLGESISESLASFFWTPKNSDTRTPIQQLFPELCVEKRPGGNWDTPMRIPGSLDTTLAFTSPRMEQAGWHPWVECIDDMVATENSGIHASDEMRQEVIDTYYTNKNCLLAGGYVYFRGTRYHPFELHGDILDKMNPEEWRVLVRSALTVKLGKKLLPGEFPEESDVILNFPEMPGMDYKSLRQKFFDDYESFMCQQMNDPSGGHIATFDEDLYKSMLIVPERIPVLGDNIMCWRLPYGGKDYMLAAEGAMGRIHDGKVYILDAWAGHYTPSRLAEKIVRECREHQTEALMLEDLPGITYMEAHIRNEMARRNVSFRINWLEFQDDDNIRFERIKQLEPQARAGRVFISNGTGKMGELKQQLVNFGLMRENGIVDCISRLAARVPISLMRQEIEDEEAEMIIRRQNEGMYHFVYGGMERDAGIAEMASKKAREREAHEAAMQRVQNLGLTDILGGLDG